MTVGAAVDAHDEIDGEHGLRIVAEGSQQFGAFQLMVVDKAHGGPALIGEAFAQIEQQMALACGIGETLTRRAWCGGKLAVDTIFFQVYAVIARRGLLCPHHRTVAVVVDIQGTGRRHEQQ